jgi:hypothetical protein
MEFWRDETNKHHGISTGISSCSIGVDTMGCTGLWGLLVTGLLAIDYAQLTHLDPDDCGLTVVFRCTNANVRSIKAYHFVQPTLWCEGKRGVICIQKAGTLTAFRARRYAHTSTYNEHKADPEHPSIGVACIQKMKTLKVSEKRSDVLEDTVSFSVLSRYYS